MALRHDVMIAIGCEEHKDLTVFQLFLREKFDNRQSVIHCRDGVNKCQYLVICSKIRAQSSGLNNRHGFVTVEAPGGAGEVLLSCANTHCRRKGTKVLKDPKLFCPHTELMWKDSEALLHIHQHLGITEWGIGNHAELGSGSSEGEDDGVPQDRVLVVDDDGLPEGENLCESEWNTSVKFHIESGRWIPSGNHKWNAIPEEHNERTRRWADSRAAGVGVMRDESGFLLWKDGTLISTVECSPTRDTCPKCGSANLARIQDGTFSLFTCLGLIRRKQFMLQCSVKGNNHNLCHHIQSSRPNHHVFHQSVVTKSDGILVMNASIQFQMIALLEVCTLSCIHDFKQLIDFSPAGYEHIFEFVNILFGKEGVHRGIRGNMLFYQGHMNEKIQKGDQSRKGFFSTPAQCRSFLQSGIACWMQSFPHSIDEPCCDLSCVGGDGTSIGVTQKNAMHLDSIWEPAVEVPPRIQWGRNIRRPLQWDVEGDPADRLSAEFQLIDEPNGTASQRGAASRTLLDILRNDCDLPTPEGLEDLLKPIQKAIANEYRRWCGLDRKEAEYTPLRQLLIACLSSESITGAIPRALLQALTSLLAIETNPSLDSESKKAQFQQALLSNRDILSRVKIGVHTLKILNYQGSAFCDLQGGTNIRRSTLALFLHLGITSLPFYIY